MIDQSIVRAHRLGSRLALFGCLLCTWLGGGFVAAEGLKVAVLEHPDRWTKGAVGAGQLLEENGATVIPLDPARSPQQLSVDALVFGSFVNNAPQYEQYIAAHGQALRDFVFGGGVVLLMTQSDQYGARVDWLPEGLLATRGDEDLAEVTTVAREGRQHPLLDGWAPDFGDCKSRRSAATN
jgi:hypothetical protein